MYDEVISPWDDIGRVYGKPSEYHDNWESLAIDIGPGQEFPTPAGVAKMIANDRYNLSEYDNRHDTRITLVFQIGDRRFKKTGMYDSWDSDHWDDGLTEVRKVEKTIIDWEDV